MLTFIYSPQRYKSTVTSLLLSLWKDIKMLLLKRNAHSIKFIKNSLNKLSKQIQWLSKNSSQKKFSCAILICNLLYWLPPYMMLSVLDCRPYVSCKMYELQSTVFACQILLLHGLLTRSMCGKTEAYVLCE